MKKLLLAVLALAMTLGVKAQTNFRSLTLEQAAAAAKKENKKVFVDFYTTWCGPCKKMANSVFPEKAVGDYMNKEFVCIKLDAEKEGKADAQKYGINAFPTFVVLNADKTLLNTFTGYSEPTSFVLKIKNAMNPSLTPEKMKEAYDKGERNPELVYAYAEYIMNSNKNDRNVYAQNLSKATMIVWEYYHGLDSKARMDKDNMFVYSTYLGNVDSEPFRFMIEHKNEFPAEQKAQLEGIIKDTFHNLAWMYLMGGRVNWNDTQKNYFRDDIKTLKLDQDSQLGKFYQFIYIFDDSNEEKYLLSCDKSFEYLDTMQLQSFVFNFSNHFTNSEFDVRKKAADYLEKNFNRIPDAKMLMMDKQIKDLRRPKEDFSEASVNARNEAQAKKVIDGAMAPDFTRVDINGKTVKLSSYKGKYVMLDFWGTWCGPCVKAMPGIRKMYDKYKSTGKLEVISMSDVLDSDKVWREATKRFNMNWIQVRDEDPDTYQTVSFLYQVKAMPTMIIISPEGKILKRYTGENPEMYTFIDSLLK